MQLKRFPVRLRRRRTGRRRRAEAPRKGSGSRSLPVVHSALLRGAGQRQSPPALEAFSGGGGPALRRGERTAPAPGSLGNSPKVGRNEMRRLRRDRNDAVPRTLRRGPFPAGLVGGTGGRAGPLPSGGQPSRPPHVGRSSYGTGPLSGWELGHTSRRGRWRPNGCIRPVLKHGPRSATRVRVFGRQTRRAQ